MCIRANLFAALVQGEGPARNDVCTRTQYEEQANQESKREWVRRRERTLSKAKVSEILLCSNACHIVALHCHSSASRTTRAFCNLCRLLFLSLSLPLPSPRSVTPCAPAAAKYILPIKSSNRSEITEKKEFQHISLFILSAMLVAWLRFQFRAHFSRT